jgi:hypothetical protein
VTVQILVLRGFTVPTYDLSVFSERGPARAAVLQRGARGGTFHLTRLCDAAQDYAPPKVLTSLERALSSAGVITLSQLAQKSWPSGYDYPHPLNAPCDTIQICVTEHLLCLNTIYRGQVLLPTIGSIELNDEYPEDLPRDVPTLILHDEDWWDTERYSQHDKLRRLNDLEDDIAAIRHVFGKTVLPADAPVIYAETKR